MQANLPAPSPEALAHSEQLCELIRQDIATQGGWIPFSRFMELALYAPGLGYYTAGSRKFGEAGDFITAPELSN
ncbi:MAG: class I SAM-dependent methyltransferase, partial [Sideroxydans sp.]